MNKRIIISVLNFFIFFSLITFFNSCSDDSNPSAPQLNTKQLIKLDSAYANSLVSFGHLDTITESGMVTGYDCLFKVGNKNFLQ